MWKKLYCGGLESNKMKPWEKINLELKNVIEELIEEGFLIRHPKKKNFIAITEKGQEEVKRFMNINPSMSLLIQQSVVGALMREPIKKGKFFLEKK